MADRGGYDIRLEAAAAKEWNTVQGLATSSTTRCRSAGGRGYETDGTPCAARGERTDSGRAHDARLRINTIFEGSSEIMHLFMAREAVDRHLQIAGAMIDPEKTAGQKLAALPLMAAFYATWYPTRWIGWGRWPRYSEFGPLATHLRFVERKSRKLARSVFHAMIVYGAKLQKKQALLFRMVDVANELFAMASAVSRARQMKDDGHTHAEEALVLADLFCRDSRRRVREYFRSLWQNDDYRKYQVGQQVLRGRHAWLEDGLVGIDAYQSKAASARSAREEAESLK